MSKIDIRTHQVEAFNAIVFADDHSDYYASEMGLSNDCGETIIKFSDSDGDYGKNLKFEDIDNLILALKKAKELWGDK